MKKFIPLLPLFHQFIRDSETGKRLKKNGERITPGSIRNYRYTFNNLSKFHSKFDFDLRICNAQKLTTREHKSEKNYWKHFYKKFTQYLYKKGCYDNYVGSNIKHIRTFFNYLKNDKDIITGEFYRLFYVRKEEIDILVLSIEQLKFLIHDKNFNASLSAAENKVKDAFIFGCITGLRFSDLFLLTNINFQKESEIWYLKLRSQKTKTYSNIKLPDYLVSVYHKYKKNTDTNPLFTSISLNNFNQKLKNIGEKAGFTMPIAFTREQQGKIKKISKKKIRFCDKMSSHMMRRTAITSMLILGMPEHLVKKISGHGSDSKSFNRYVHYAQVYIDMEIDKVHKKLNEYRLP